MTTKTRRKRPTLDQPAADESTTNRAVVWAPCSAGATTMTMAATMTEIEIHSTWGRTTKAMRRAVARVREDCQRELATSPEHGWRIRRLFALKEILEVRFKKCGERVSRDLVARVARYYQADTDQLWSMIIEPYGGPEQVSPDFQLDPTFLSPRLSRVLTDAAGDGGAGDGDGENSNKD